MNIKIDSRKVKKGDIFVALRTLNNDGHDYIEDAIKNGASKIIAEYGSYDIDYEIVNNTREYLAAYLKENYYDLIKDIKLIGVTGTNGKTTSCFSLYQALNILGIKSAYIGTIGFYMDEFVSKLNNTTPELLDIYELLIECKKNNVKVVVMEVSSHALSMNRVEGLLFDTAIFTNLTQDHLDYHKTLENYRKEKEKLFDMCKNAIINIDDDNSKYFIKDRNNNYTYGKNESDYIIKNIKLTENGSSFSVKHKGKEVNYKTKLLGEYNIYNLLNVIIYLDTIGICDEVKVEVISKINHPSGRMEIIDYKNNKIIIDYAHSPDAVNKIISSVKSFAKSRIITIVGCGGNRDRSKRPLMVREALKSDYAILTSDNPRNENQSAIFEDMIYGVESDNFEIVYDRSEAIYKGIKMLKDSDILLILGKGHEDYQIIGDKKYHFSDREEVLKYIL